MSQNIPDELWGLITSFIEVDDLLSLCRLSTKFSTLGHDLQFWRNKIFAINPHYLIPHDVSLFDSISIYKKINRRGYLYMMGINHVGVLGLGNIYFQQSPALVMAKNDIIQVSCGDSHTAAISSDGKIYVWGLPFRGKLGILSPSPSIVTTPISIPHINKALQISCGLSFTAFVTQDGQVYIFGDNESGVLSLPPQIYHIPTKIPGLDNIKISQVSCGYNGIVMLSYGREVYIYGSNINGQLGLGPDFDVYPPTRIPGLENIVQVACGNNIISCISATGEVYISGLGINGQLGMGNTHYIYYPTVVPRLPPAKMIAFGKTHSVVLTTNGEVYSWGKGVEDHDIRTIPERITNLPKIKQMLAENIIR